MAEKKYKEREKEQQESREAKLPLGSSAESGLSTGLPVLNGRQHWTSSADALSALGKLASALEPECSGDIEHWKTSADGHLALEVQAFSQFRHTGRLLHGRTLQTTIARLRRFRETNPHHPGCLMLKRDLSRAYRQIPMDPHDYDLLGFR
ncbi:hypothetical protein Bbelb_318810 [Branchiostoma belcheri]|nr:hypothetical protein Bbelb_318810 [Branchiostoma belcheri]